MADLTTVLGAALAVFVGTIFAFGHRYSGESGKFDDKSKADDLNDIIVAMREVSTVPALIGLWNFLVETDQVMKKDGLQMDVGRLFYDLARRDQFNEIITRIEHTFSEALSVKESWESLRLDIGRLGTTLYSLAIVAGGSGYSIIITNALFPNYFTFEDSVVIGILLLVLGVAFFWHLFSIRRRVLSLQKHYQDAKRKYVIDEPKIR